MSPHVPPLAQRAGSGWSRVTGVILVVAPYLLAALVHRPKRLVYLSSGMHRGGRADVTGVDWSGAVPSSLVRLPTRSSWVSGRFGNLFRYDATSGQYIFNLATKTLSAGTYQLRIDLGDGVLHTVNISLR